MNPVILVVEDEQHTRDGIVTILKSWQSGLEVVTAQNGRRALEVFRDRHVDLMITDVRMPFMGGLELLVELDLKGIKIPTIILSAYADFNYAREAIHMGVYEYILKPVDPALLIKGVELCLMDIRGVGAKNIAAQVLESVQPSGDADGAGAPRKVWNASIQAAMDYTAKNFMRNVGAREIADHVSLNPSYFCTLFKSETGLTFSDYLARLRIGYSKKLLLSTDLRVCDIALACGYQTSRYFAKLFHEAGGTTPREFRRLFRGKDIQE